MLRQHRVHLESIIAVASELFQVGITGATSSEFARLI